MSVAENLKTIRDRVDAACERAGRRPEEVTLIAVSKTKPLSMLQEAYGAGARDFGENKVQEILEKYPEMPEDARFHMIGHLQTNKVKQVVGKTVLIHSVDSLHLAESKFGLMLEEVIPLLEEVKNLPHVRVRGLMTIAPNVENPEENRKHFKKLYQLYVDIKSKNIDNGTMTALSMGMTGDFEVAVEEGATMIRVGTGIFGSR